MNQNQCFRYLNVGLPEDILRHKLHGDFESALRLIDQRLAKESLPAPLRACLTAQREIIVRLPLDYPYSRAEALAILRRHVPDFPEALFDQWVDEGKIGWIYVGGEMRFFDRFFETLCKADPAFAVKAGVQLAGAESAVTGKDLMLDRTIEKMKREGSAANRIRIRATVRLKEELFHPGMAVRVHLPLPAACETQSDIVIEKVEPPTGQIAPEDAPQRTVCWQETLDQNKTFTVEYSYTHRATYHDVAKIVADPVQPDFYTNEQAPHILFTPYIRELAARLAEGTDDPLEKARRFYDFITLNMKYTFMPAYFSLENIAESCARNFTGDCGVFALLFLTLCRCVGIPACWQSGFAAEPDFCGGHDWVRFYIAPYGWLYADTSYGIAAVRGQNEERRKFYFGNLDPFRMVANNEFQADFTIDKEHWRADPYDNQVGEMETADRGLRFEEFERTKQVLLCQEI